MMFRRIVQQRALYGTSKRLFASSELVKAEVPQDIAKVAE